MLKLFKNKKNNEKKFYFYKFAYLNLKMPLSKAALLVREMETSILRNFPKFQKLIIIIIKQYKFS